MDFLAYLKESTVNSLSSLLTMAKIIIPLMIVMEVLKDAKVLEKVSEKLKPIARFYNISNGAVFPLLVGIFFGLAYGAGVIIESAEDNNLGSKDLYTIIIFLIICHAIVEDTLIFTVVGANLWLLFFTRLIVAIIITFFASKIFDKSFLEKEIGDHLK